MFKATGRKGFPIEMEYNEYFCIYMKHKPKTSCPKPMTYLEYINSPRYEEVQHENKRIKSCL